HGRAVGGKETGNDEHRRPVLGPARPERPKAGEDPREMPGNLAHSPPRRRCDVVGMNSLLALGWAERSGSSFPPHALKHEVFPLTKQYQPEISCAFSGACPILRHHPRDLESPILRSLQGTSAPRVPHPLWPQERYQTPY